MREGKNKGRRDGWEKKRKEGERIIKGMVAR